MFQIAKIEIHRPNVLNSNRYVMHDGKPEMHLCQGDAEVSSNNIVALSLK